MNYKGSSGKVSILAILVFAVVLLVGAAVLAFANADRLIAWQVRETALGSIQSNEAAQTIPNSRFEVLFCGTGTPSFNATRGQPCLAIIAGGRLLLFDAGQGSAQRLSRFKAPTESLEAVFLTHLHSDHMSGLGEVLHHSWMFGRDRRVEVVGPPGTARVLRGFREVFAEDEYMRRDGVEVNYEVKNSAFGQAREVLVDSDEAVTVYDKGGIVVKAFQVVHREWQYAYGYRIDFGGKAVVVSGDTAYTPAIARHGRGADMLIHEAMNVEFMTAAAEAMAGPAGTVSETRLQHIRDRHTPTEDVARSAHDAEVETVVLTHFTPPIPANGLIERLFARGMSEIFDGDIVVARDGMRLTLIE